ncbi:MAG: hypothetical protein AB7G75_09445 [Candidatus Binatia bacterium]
MKRLWKGLAVVVTVGMLCGVGSTARAVVGIPDDVPAATLLYPFFKVDPNRTGQSAQDTIFVVSDVANHPVHVHITIWSIRSEHVFDFTALLSEHDVFSCSVYDLLLGGIGCTSLNGLVVAPPQAAAQLTTTINGKPMLAGYITADTAPGNTSLFPGQAGYQIADCNILIGHEYIVDLPAGSSTGFNAVSIEHTRAEKGQPAPPFPNSTIGFYLNRCLENQGVPCVYDLLERIDAPNGDIAQTRTNDTPALKLILRYFTAANLQARTEVWLWKDRNTNIPVTLSVYDEDENVFSITQNFPNEVNFVDVAGIIIPGAPGGWFRVPFNTAQFAPSSTGIQYGPIQAVAYALQLANSQSAQLRWDAIFPAHRQYTNFLSFPPGVTNPE